MLFLDEPTAGVDPISRRAFWDYLYDLADAGRTLFVTTHYMDEAESCRRLAFIDGGHIIAEGTPSELKAPMAGAVLEVTAERSDAALLAVRAAVADGRLPELDVALYGAQLHVVAPDAAALRQPLTDVLVAADTGLQSIEAVAPSLEDVFVSRLRVGGSAGQGDGAGEVGSAGQGDGAGEVGSAGQGDGAGEVGERGRRKGTFMKRMGGVVLVVALVALIGLVLWYRPDSGSGLGDWRELLGLEESQTDLVASGFVEARQVVVAPEVGGPVVAVNVAEGDEVQAGDVLFELDPDLVDIQEQQAQAALDAAYARLDQLQSGARPEQLAALATGVDEARGALDAAEAALQAAESAAVGAVDGTAAATLLAAARARANGARAGLDLAQARLTQAQAGPSEPLLRAAEAGVRQAEARLATVDVQREKLTVRAPISGTVSQVLLKIRETAAVGRPGMRLARLDPLTLTVYVPEDELGRVEVGQEVEVRVDGYPDDVFDGQIVAIAGEAEFTPRNVQTREERSNLVFAVRISLPNPDGDLKPGMAADATLDEG